MIDKTVASCGEAMAQVFDGATIMFGGFGNPGVPANLIEAIHNGAGMGDFALGGLFLDGWIRKLTASFPMNPGNWAFRHRYLKGEVELELVLQGCAPQIFATRHYQLTSHIRSVDILR